MENQSTEVLKGVYFIDYFLSTICYFACQIVSNYRPPGGGPLFVIHLGIVTAFLRDSFF